MSNMTYSFGRSVMDEADMRVQLFPGYVASDWYHTAKYPYKMSTPDESFENYFIGAQGKVPSVEVVVASIFHDEYVYANGLSGIVPIKSDALIDVAARKDFLVQVLGESRFGELVDYYGATVYLENDATVHDVEGEEWD